MKTIALSLLILFLAVVAHAQNWYEPVPCYACDVDTSYERSSDWDRHLGQAQRGYAPNYGLGSNPTGPGTLYGNQVEIEQARQAQQRFRDQQAQYDRWNAEVRRQQERLEDRMFQDSQRRQSQGSYGVPDTGKPIAPCGPYYAPRAAKNCY